MRTLKRLLKTFKSPDVMQNRILYFSAFTWRNMEIIADNVHRPRPNMKHRLHRKYYITFGKWDQYPRCVCLYNLLCSPRLTFVQGFWILHFHIESNHQRKIFKQIRDEKWAMHCNSAFARNKGIAQTTQFSAVVYCWTQIHTTHRTKRLDLECN